MMKDSVNGNLDSSINNAIEDIKKIGKLIKRDAGLQIPGEESLISNLGIPLSIRAIRVYRSKKLKSVKLKLYKGEKISVHFHPHRREIITVLEGNFHIGLHNDSKIACAGDTIIIEPNIEHWLDIYSDTELLVTWVLVNEL